MTEKLFEIFSKRLKVNHVFTIKEIIKATQGTLLQGDASSNVSGVSSDTRMIKEGNLFIALKGPNFDGHSFLSMAVQKGAKALVVSQKPRDRFSEKIDIILVADTRKALGSIAGFHRKRFKIPVIAITGSSGKTTTKEMLAAVLTKRYNVLKNIATENNDVGVPSTLLKLNHDHDIAVLEFGTNHFGEIRWLTQVTSPTVSILLNIGESHLEYFKSLSGVFKEKFDIVRFMKKPGVVIYNKDDRFLKKIPEKKIFGRKISFGLQRPADFLAQEIEIVRHQFLRFKINTNSFQIQAPIWHNVYNALATISCARLFKVSWVDIEIVLKEFSFPKGRQVFHSIGSLNVIDDTYNANPVSFRSAVRTLQDLDSKGRKILLCADMLELGEKSRDLHREVGGLVASAEFDFVFSIGRLAQLITQEVRKKKVSRAFHFSTIERLTKELKDILRPGDTILVKGSRGMHLEKIVDFLKKEFGK